MKSAYLLIALILISSAHAVKSGQGITLIPVQVAQSDSVEASQKAAIAEKNAQFPEGQYPLPSNVSLIDGKGFAQVSNKNSANSVTSREELGKFLGALEQGDTAIIKLNYDGSRISLSYPYKVKIFAFIPVTAAIETQMQVKPKSRVKVVYPWWIILTNADTFDVQTGIEDALNEQMNSYDDATEGDMLAARLALAMVQANQAAAK